MQQKTLIIGFIILAALFVLMYFKQKQLAGVLNNTKLEKFVLSPKGQLLFILFLVITTLLDSKNYQKSISNKWVIAIYFVALVFFIFNIFFRKKKNIFAESNITNRVMNLIIFVFLIYPLIIYFLK